MSDKAPADSVSFYDNYVAYDGHDWHVCSVNQSGLLLRRLSDDNYKLVNHDERLKFTRLEVTDFGRQIIKR